MLFERELKMKFQGLWADYQLRLRRKAELKFRSEGIKFHWTTSNTSTPMGIMPQQRPVIDYIDPGRARQPGSVSSNPHRFYSRLEDELENVVYEKITNFAGEMIGRELAEHFDLFESRKVLKRLDIIDKQISNLAEAKGRLLSTGKAQNYAAEATFFRKRSQWMLRATKGRLPIRRV